MLYINCIKGVMHMSQYIEPDVLAIKGEELWDIVNKIGEIAQATEDIVADMRKMSELEGCAESLQKVEVAMFSDSHRLMQLSEALYEIVYITKSTENEIIGRIEEGDLRRASYAKSASLNRIDPEKIDFL